MRKNNQLLERRGREKELSIKVHYRIIRVNKRHFTRPRISTKVYEKGYGQGNNANVTFLYISNLQDLGNVNVKLK